MDDSSLLRILRNACLKLSGRKRIEKPWEIELLFRAIIFKQLRHERGSFFVLSEISFYLT